MTTRKAEWLELLDDADRDTTTTLDVVFKTIFSEVDDRLSGAEDGVADFRAIEGKLVETALTYLAERLEPEFDRVRAVADLGLLFEARAETEVTVGLGTKSFVVVDEDRGRFSAPGYIGVFKIGDTSVFMAGTRVSYDRASGLLTVDVDRIAGGGVTATDWQIVAVSGTDFMEAAAAAEAARDLAAVYRTEAQNARDIAIDHVGTANTHRMAAAGAQAAAETAQGLAEDARDAAGVHLSGVQAIATHYLGPSASNPTTKPGGGALEAGDLYWNTAADEMRTWNGSTWGAAYVPGGADVVSWNGRTGAVTPADADYSAGQIVVSPTVEGANRVQAALTALQTLANTKIAASSSGAFGMTLLGTATQATARTALAYHAIALSGSAADLGTGTLPDARLPARIGVTAAPLLDWNDATTTGFYMAYSAANAPTAPDWAIGLVVAHNSNWVTQEVHCFTADSSADTKTYRRAKNNGTWEAWYRVRKSEAELNTLYAAFGHIHADATTAVSGFMSAADKSKLDGIATNANNYVHPTGDGSLHVPANGTTNANKVLRATGTAGSYTWGFVAYSEITGVPDALGAIDGLTPAADRLAYYTGATTAALTTFTALARSLCGDATQAEMLATIGAAASGHTHANATTSVAGFMSPGDKSKLDGIAAGAQAIPARLGTTSVGNGITDWNDALQSGWYYGSSTAANTPLAATCAGVVVAYNSLYVRQIAWGLGGGSTYRRDYVNGVWGAWALIQDRKADQDARYALAAHTQAYSTITSLPAAIDALDELTPTADRLPYFTGANSAALTTFTAAARTLLDDASVDAMRTTLGTDWDIAVGMTALSGLSVLGATGLDAYSELMLVCRGLTLSGAGLISVQVGNSGGYFTNSYRGTSTTGFFIYDALAGADVVECQMHIVGFGNSLRPAYTSIAAWGSNSTFVSAGMHDSALANDRLQIKCSAGTFDNGHIWILGKR